jgi:hypothetical protein
LKGKACFLDGLRVLGAGYLADLRATNAIEGIVCEPLDVKAIVPAVRSRKPT